MATGSFPPDPAQRKVILVLQQHDIEKCAYEPDAAKALLDDEAYVLQFPIDRTRELPQALEVLVRGGLARPGSVLVQSPFDSDIYEDASLAPQKFALAKHMLFSTLCMHLGAKEVVVEQVDLRTKSGKSTLDVKAERAGIGGQLSIESEELERFRSQMHLRDEFAGGTADLNAAEDLLRRTGLISDPGVRTLVEMRRGGSNPLMKRRLVLSLSSEAKSNLSIVGRIKIPSFVKLSAAYEKVIKEEHEYTLTVVVQF